MGYSVLASPLNDDIMRDMFFSLYMYTKKNFFTKTFNVTGPCGKRHTFNMYMYKVQSLVTLLCTDTACRLKLKRL